MPSPAYRLPASRWPAHRLPAGRACCLALALAAAALGRSPAQTTAAAPPDQPLTLAVQSRLVVEDILVFDRDGHPVFNLPASAFHLSDNDHPQNIRSFEQGSTPPSATPPASPLPPGTFRNISDATDHTATEVLLIDADSMSVPDQMYLLEQLQRSLDALPPGLAVAVFRVSNTRVVQIRSFDTDRADLHRAVGECLPVLTRRVDNPFASAVDQLLTVAAYLEQTPGRKNILWFAGAYPLVSISDAEGGGHFSPNIEERLHIIHQMQEGLAEARVSVYPIDVRGVIPGGASAVGTSNIVTGSYPGGPGANTITSGTPSSPSILGMPASGVLQERDEMRSLAAATGGRAYTLNHLAPEIDEAFTLGLRAYALSYTPVPYQNDDSWHRVRITVDTPPTVAGPLSLSYRPGYLATWSGVAGGRVGIRLAPGSTKVPTGGAASATAAAPLAFEVHIEAGSPDATHRHTILLNLRLAVPAAELDFQHTATGWRNQLVIATYVYDAGGRIKGGRLQQLKSTVSDAQWPVALGKRVPVTQSIEVPAKADYLMLELRDSGNMRAGSLMLPMRVVRSLIPASPDQAAPAPASPPSTVPSPPEPPAGATAPPPPAR